MSARPGPLTALPGLVTVDPNLVKPKRRPAELPEDFAVDGSKVPMFTATDGITIDRPVVQMRVAINARTAGYTRELFDAIRAEALTRLSAVQIQVDRSVSQFADLVDPDWRGLEADVATDRALLSRSDKLHFELRRLRTAVSYVPRARMPKAFADAYRTRIDAIVVVLDEIKQQRTALRTRQPSLALIETNALETPVTREVIRAAMVIGGQQMQAHLDDVYRRVEDGDIPLHRLDRLVPQVLETLGAATTDNPRAIAMRDAIERMRNADEIVEIGATAAAVVLGIAALVATGGTAAVLGAVGAAVGLGASARDFEIADDLNDVGQAALVDGDALVDPATARERYVSAAINLTLAAADALLSGLSVFKLARAASLRRAPTAVQEVFAKLSPEQLVALDRARPQDLERLATELDPDTFLSAKQLIVDRSLARAAVPDLSERAFADLYINLGADGVRSLASKVPANALARLRAEMGGETIAKLIGRHGEDAFVKVASALEPAEATALLAGLRRMGPRIGTFVEAVDPRFLSSRLKELGARELVRQMETFGPRGLADAVEALGDQGAAALMRSRPKGAVLSTVVADLKDPAVRAALAKVDGNAVAKLLSATASADDIATIVARAERLGPAHMGDEIVGYLANQPQGAVHREIDFAKQALAVELADGGHALARHGPQIPDEALRARVHTGVAPDGKISTTPASTQFASFRAFVVSRERAMKAWADDVGVDLSRPPPASWDKRIRRAADKATGPTFEAQDDAFNVDHLDGRVESAVGYIGRPGAESSVRPATFLKSDRAASLHRTTTRLAWIGDTAEPRRGRWVIAQHFPSARDFDGNAGQYARVADAKFE